MGPGGKIYTLLGWGGILALGLGACANRFPKSQEQDPLEEYYSSRPRYQPEPEWTPTGPALTPPSLTNPARTSVRDQHTQGDQMPVLPEVPQPVFTHNGAAATSGAPISLVQPPAPGQASRVDHSTPVNVNGSGSFKSFGVREAAVIRSGVLGGSQSPQFKEFEPLVDRMMDLKRWPKDVHTVDPRTEALTKTSFDMTDKLFCEDFKLAETGIPSFYARGNRTLRSRWEGPDGKQAVAEMQRVNKAHNQILRAYKAAREKKDTVQMTELNRENAAFWKTFMSCLSYSESGVFWNRPDPKKWRSNWNDYGIYQLNPDQRSGGNLNDCVRNWNQEYPNELIDEKRFRANAEYRRTMVTTVDQRFNTFCGLSKIHQNLSDQAKRSAGCLNPFKKSYNHFGALMQNSDLNFLRCTAKLIPSPGAQMTAEQALDALRAPGTGRRVEGGVPAHAP